MMVKSVLDLHTHTVASGHAYNSLREMARSASDKGLELLGITEHAPSMPGSCQWFYFQNLTIVPRQLYGIELLLGSEVNIMDTQGTLDLSQRDLRELDLTIASMHTPCMKSGSVQENTYAYQKVLENPEINIIGHPDDGRFPVDYRALVKTAADYGKVLEINNHSLDPDCSRQNARENDLEMLALCKEYRVPVVMSSDAHFDTLIGEFPNIYPLMEELDFPEDLVLNRSVESLRPYVNRFKL